MPNLKKFKFLEISRRNAKIRKIFKEIIDSINFGAVVIFILKPKFLLWTLIIYLISIFLILPQAFAIHFWSPIGFSVSRVGNETFNTLTNFTPINVSEGCSIVNNQLNCPVNSGVTYAPRPNPDGNTLPNLSTNTNNFTIEWDMGFNCQNESNLTLWGKSNKTSEIGNSITLVWNGTSLVLIDQESGAFKSIIPNITNDATLYRYKATFYENGSNSSNVHSISIAINNTNETNIEIFKSGFNFNDPVSISFGYESSHCLIIVDNLTIYNGTIFPFGHTIQNFVFKHTTPINENASFDYDEDYLMAPGRYAGVKINISNVTSGNFFSIINISKTSECTATLGYIFSNSTSLQELATCSFIENDCVFSGGYNAYIDSENGTILRLATRSISNWDARATDTSATAFPTMFGTKIKWIDGFIDDGSGKWLTYNIAHCINSLWGEELIPITNASLTVTKLVINNDTGTKDINDFTLNVNNTIVISGVPIIFDPGVYQVSELQDVGYNSSISGDCDSEGFITLNSGENKTCIITNDDIPVLENSSLTLIKIVVNNDTCKSTNSNFTLRINETVVEEGVSINIQPGFYNVNEIQNLAYIQSFLGDCDSNGNILLKPKQNKTCILLNDDITPGIIKGIKFRDSNGNGVKDVNEPRLRAWRIYIDSNDNGFLDKNEISVLTNINGSYQFNGLGIGTYVIREQLKAGWTLTLPSGGKHIVSINGSGVVVNNIDFGNKR